MLRRKQQENLLVYIVVKLTLQRTIDSTKTNLEIKQDYLVIILPCILIIFR